MAQPSIFINHSGMLDVTWVYANANENMSFGLYHTTYEQQSVQKADYTAVNEAIDKVNALNKNDYEDFSAVTDAVNAVEYDKDYTEQETVEGHAKAIEKATARKKAAKKKAATTPQGDAIIGTPCPLCGKGTIIKGKTAYGCSEWKNGCTYRKPF